MSITLMSAHRPHFAGNEPSGGTVEEQAQAYRTYRSYCGRYELFGDTVVHHVEVNLFPNWSGEDLVRQVEWDGDQLILKTRPSLVGGKQGVWYLIWKRVSSHK
jgi:Lipocalin-like domain